jgi:hypothetical protein
MVLFATCENRSFLTDCQFGGDDSARGTIKMDQSSLKKGPLRPDCGAEEQVSVASPLPPWASTAPEARRCRLVCVAALGNQVTLLSVDDRSITLPRDAAINIGREANLHLLETLLAHEPGRHHLDMVSRRHLVMESTADEYGSCFQVTNRSQNPIIVAGQKLGQGRCVAARPGDDIDFIAAGEHGSREPVVYLRFRVQEVLYPAGISFPAGVALRLQELDELYEQKLQSFLASNAFQHVNDAQRRRRNMSSGITYPLHAAVQANDIDAVKALLWGGANAFLMDSSRATPLALARKLDKNGSHKQVLLALSN